MNQVTPCTVYIANDTVVIYSYFENCILNPSHLPPPPLTPSTFLWHSIHIISLQIRIFLTNLISSPPPNRTRFQIKTLSMLKPCLLTSVRLWRLHQRNSIKCKRTLRRQPQQPSLHRHLCKAVWQGHSVRGSPWMYITALDTHHHLPVCVYIDVILQYLTLCAPWIVTATSLMRFSRPMHHHANHATVSIKC